MQSTTYNGVEYRFYDHLYAVARDGSLLRKLQPFTPVRRKDGYLQAGRCRLVHRMVAICWLHTSDEKNSVHHKDRDKANNHADNLEWVDPRKHMIDHHQDVVERFNRYERTERHKQHLRELRLGTKTSEETKRKQREANLRLGIRPPVQYGRKMTEANKAKLRAANQQPCEVFGVRYESFKEAGESLGIRPLTLRKRCLSPNFSDYRVV